MKKLLFVLLACLFVFTSCEPYHSGRTLINKSSYDIEFKANDKNYSIQQGKALIINYKDFDNVVITTKEPVYLGKGKMVRFFYDYTDSQKNRKLTVNNNTTEEIEFTIKDVDYDYGEIKLSASEKNKEISYYHYNLAIDCKHTNYSITRNENGFTLEFK